MLVGFDAPCCGLGQRSAGCGAQVRAVVGWHRARVIDRARVIVGIFHHRSTTFV
jgi:hypothetical protein